MFLKKTTMESVTFSFDGSLTLMALAEKYLFYPIHLLNFSIDDQTCQIGFSFLLKVCINADVSEKNYDEERNF